MKTLIYKFVRLIGILLSAVLVFNSCSKSETGIVTTSSSSPGYLESTLLNRDLAVSAAIDDGINITDNFSRYTFRLTGTTGGTATAINDTTMTGTWSLNSTKDKIAFDFPPTLNNQQPLEFINKEWIISSGSNPVKLTAASGQNDVLYFTGR